MPKSSNDKVAVLISGSLATERSSTFSFRIPVLSFANYKESILKGYTP